MLKLTLLAALAAASVTVLADRIEVEFADAIQVASDAQGFQNCPNKCQNLLNNQAYAANTQGGSTYEALACAAGCDICSKVLAANDTPDVCFTVCKDTNWLQMVDASGNPVVVQKGVIEPDKACEFGCVIGTCQAICQGGTTDIAPTPTNQPAWWGNGGCSIKTGAIRPGGYYSQNSNYNYYNAPQGSGGQSDCCAQAYSLCNYAGDTTTTNYQQVLAQAQKWCNGVPGAGNTQAAICSYFAVASNCGNQLSSGR